MSAAASIKMHKWHCELMPGKWAVLGPVEVGLVEFGPGICQQIIDRHSGGNRPVIPGQVEFLSHVLADLQWLLTGETIIFSTEEKLLNGQHRMCACIATGIAFTSLVVVGIDPKAFAVMDQHRKRTFGQVLTIIGEQNTTVLASVVSMLDIFKKTGVIKVGSQKQRSTSDLLNVFSAHSDVVKAVDWVKAQNGLKLFGSDSLPALLVYLAGQVNEELVKRMVKVLLEATIPETTEWNGCRLLHKRLTENMASRKKYSKIDVAAFLVKTWNVLLAGDHLRGLTWTSKEDFPRVAGWTYEDGLPVRANRVDEGWWTVEK